MATASKRASEHHLWQQFNRDIDAQWPAMKAAFVDAVWLRMMRDPWLRLFAYYKPSSGRTWGELIAVSETETVPDGFFPVVPTCIPSGPKEQIRRWFEPLAQRLPILPVWPR